MNDEVEEMFKKPETTGSLQKHEEKSFSSPHLDTRTNSWATQK